MKILQLSIPTAALALAFAISLPPDSAGFTLISGNTLGETQRDFRIFNNFTASGANNNFTPDANFPGYFGADMAIWKACIEWASRLHGDGNGDPTQPAGLGSGNANFDPTFQGAALDVGNTNQNIHSQIGGSGGGVLAFAEGPSNNGWRIRYYENISWRDGPDPINSGFDLQSVACHEYGHALGLGHTNVSGSTMLPSIGSGQEFARSIGPDDIAGCQAKYGVADPGKPIISNIVSTSGQLTISGSNFDANANAVWFTKEAAGGTGPDGVPIKVTNVPSSAGGTQIVVNIPAGVGPGDILVKLPSSGFASISNPWPVDVQGCDLPTNYCVAAPHSESGGGPGAVMFFSGSQSVSANDFTLEVDFAPSNKSGIFFYGPNQIQVVFGDGFRCVGGSTQRLPIVMTDSLGFASFTVDLTSQPNITAGSSQNFQFWYRDPMGPGGNGFNVSDGLEVPFCN